MTHDMPFSGFQFSDAKIAVSERPRIILLGSAMRFSERLLDVFRSEFSDFDFLRLGSIAEVAAARKVQDNLGLVVIEDQHIQNILDDPNAYLDAFGPVQIAIAFTDIRNATRFLSERPATGELDNVGFLPLNAQMDVWLAVMRLLLCGQTFIPQELVAEMQSTWAQPQDSQVATSLTPREWQVLELVAEGVQNKNIAADLDLSVHTVKLHIHNLLHKIGVSNRTCAASWYMQGHAKRPVNPQVPNV